jgi:hypothetical protein
MTLPVDKINYAAVAVAALAAYMLGGLWYAVGERKPKTTEKPAAPEPPKHKETKASYLASIATTFVVAWTLALLARGIGAASAFDGLALGFHCWLGFMATAAVERVVWGAGTKKDAALLAGYQLVAAMLMAVVVTVWK